MASMSFFDDFFGDASASPKCKCGKTYQLSGLPGSWDQGRKTYGLWECLDCKAKRIAGQEEERNRPVVPADWWDRREEE